MRDSLTRSEIREFDRRAVQQYGVPRIVLMENAGRGAAEVLAAIRVNGRIIVCCGKGNNGGDGFVVARHLDLRNLDVRVAYFGRTDELPSDAKINYEILTRSHIPVSVLDGPFSAGVFRKALSKADWVVDALLGTGLTGPVRPPFDQVIECINGSGRKILAVDVPSGLDCNTGQPLGPTIRAAHTVTFVALKRGYLNPQSAEWTGQVHVASIGAPRVLVREFLMPKASLQGKEQ